MKFESSMSDENNPNDEASQSTANVVSSNTDQTIHDPKRRCNILYTTAIEEYLAGLPAEAAEIACKGIAGVLYLEGEPPYAASLLRSVQEAFVIGWQQALWSGVVVMAILLVYVLLRGPENAKIT